MDSSPNKKAAAKMKRIITINVIVSK